MIQFDNVQGKIIRPSDVKVQIRLKEDSETYVDFATTNQAFQFRFTDRFRNDFICEYSAQKQKNCTVDGDDSTKLNLCLLTKNLKPGTLSLQIGCKQPDAEFDSGFWHVFKALEETNLILE